MVTSAFYGVDYACRFIEILFACFATQAYDSKHYVQTKMFDQMAGKSS